MLECDITDKRKERHHITQEDFTPDVIVELMLNKLPKDTFTNFSRKVLDNSCGIGNFLVAILQRRLKKCKTPNDALRAIKTIYGVELMADNVAECRQRLYDTILTKFPKIVEDEVLNFNIRAVIRNRIVWYDSLKFNYEWKKLRTYGDHDKTINFEERRTAKDIKYPMWYQEEKPIVKELSLFTDKHFK